MANNRFREDQVFNYAETREHMVLPRRRVAIERIRPAGSFLYDPDIQNLYYSDGLQWLPVGGTAVVNSSGQVTGSGTGTDPVRLTDGTAANQTLVWDGSNWQSQTLPLPSIADGGAGAGDVLAYNGTDWVPVAAPPATVLTLVPNGVQGNGTVGNEVRLVDGTAVNDALVWDGTGWNPQQLPLPSLEQGGAAVNNFLSWDGTNWSPAPAPSTTVQTLAAGGTQGDGTAGNEVRLVDGTAPGQMLQWDVPSNPGAWSLSGSNPTLGDGLGFDGTNWTPTSFRFLWQTTVGPGPEAEYPTVQAALNAGYNRVVVLPGTVNEPFTGPLDPSAPTGRPDLYVFLTAGAVWDLTAASAPNNISGRNVRITGLGSSPTFGASQILVPGETVFNVNGNVALDNIQVTFDGSGPVTGPLVLQIVSQQYTRVRFVFGARRGDITTPTSTVLTLRGQRNILTDCEFNANDNLANDHLFIQNGTVTNLTLRGQFDSSYTLHGVNSTFHGVLANRPGGLVTNMTQLRFGFAVPPADPTFQSSDLTLTNINCPFNPTSLPDGDAVGITLRADRTYLSNFVCGRQFLIDQGVESATVSNGVVFGQFGYSTGSQNLQMSNVLFRASNSGPYTIAGLESQITNCRFVGARIQLFGTNHIFSNCVNENDPALSPESASFSSIAVNCQFDNCRFQQGFAISGSGIDMRDNYFSNCIIDVGLFLDPSGSLGCRRYQFDNCRMELMVISVDGETVEELSLNNCIIRDNISLSVGAGAFRRCRFSNCSIEGSLRLTEFGGQVNNNKFNNCHISGLLEMRAVNGGQINQNIFTGCHIENSYNVTGLNPSSECLSNLFTGCYFGDVVVDLEEGRYDQNIFSGCRLAGGTGASYFREFGTGGPWTVTVSGCVLDADPTPFVFSSSQIHLTGSSLAGPGTFTSALNLAPVNATPPIGNRANRA